MPTKVPHPCAAAGCAALVRTGAYCAAHIKPKTTKLDRGTTKDRGYADRWPAFRSRFLSLHPMCVECQRKPADTVHHLQKLRDFPELRLVESNCQALCKSCHSRLDGEEKK